MYLTILVNQKIYRQIMRQALQKTHWPAHYNSSAASLLLIINIEISNEHQFTAIDSTKLVASDDVDSYCEDNHDQAYAALLTKAEAQKKEVASIDYAPQREA